MNNNDTHTVDLELISNNLKFLRITHGFSQEYLASEICITRSTYSTYETGVKIPDLQTLDALSAIYDIGFESLVHHDLSKGILNRVYFDNDNKELSKTLNDYQSLSIAGKNAIAERIDILLERESVFYKEYGDAKKKRVKNK